MRIEPEFIKEHMRELKKDAQFRESIQFFLFLSGITAWAMILVWIIFTDKLY